MKRRRDPYLRFGLWPTAPARPVLDQLAGRALPEVATQEASSVVEGLGLLQAARAPVAAVPVLGAAAVLDQLGVAGAWAEVMWALALAAVLVLPWYGVLVGVLSVELRRSARPDESVKLAHPRVLVGLRVAPAAAIALALASGVVLR